MIPPYIGVKVVEPHAPHLSIHDVLARFVGCNITPRLLEEVRQTVIAYALASDLGPSLQSDLIQFRAVFNPKGPWPEPNGDYPMLAPANAYTQATIAKMIPTYITCLGHGGAFAAADVGHTAYLVEHGEHRILVDCGTTVPDVLKELGIDPGSLTAILVTHLHADHAGGLERILYHRHYVSKAPPIPLVMGLKVELDWLACVRACKNDLERHVLLSDQGDAPGTDTGIRILGEGVEVAGAPVWHGGDIPEMNGYCFLIELGSSSVFFSGDRIWKHDGDFMVLNSMRHADISFHELELFSPPSGAHTNIADVIDYRPTLNIWWGHHGRGSRLVTEAPHLKLTQKGDKWRMVGRFVEPLNP